MSDRKPVGLIGIGLLGQALAHRLLGAGFEVIGFDIDPAKNAKLAALGGVAAASIADVAKRSDPIVLAVFSTDQVEQVIEHELLSVLGDSSGKIAPRTASPCPSPCATVSRWRRAISASRRLVDVTGATSMSPPARAADDVRSSSMRKAAPICGRL